MDLKSIFHRGGNRDLTKMDNVNSDYRSSSIATMPEGGEGSRLYYYVGAIYEGQPVVLGRYYSWEQANQEGKKKLTVPFEIYPLTTGDMRKATKVVKYSLLEHNNMDVVMHRARHVVEPEDIEENS
jgi:hypothetical protein